MTIIGGLLLSQLLTLYTTPVIYLAFERLRARFGRRRGGGGGVMADRCPASSVIASRSRKRRRGSPGVRTERSAWLPLAGGQ